jgi:hypothetical protein
VSIFLPGAIFIQVIVYFFFYDLLDYIFHFDFLLDIFFNNLIGDRLVRKRH